MTPTSDALREEISALADVWTQALVDGDIERTRSFMTDDFSITTAGWLDTPADRGTWLAHAFERFHLDWFEYDDVRIRRYSDIVISQARCRQRGTDLSTGRTWAMVFLYSDPRLLHGGAW